jgi:hypothetical protein
LQENSQNAEMTPSLTVQGLVWSAVLFSPQFCITSSLTLHKNNISTSTCASDLRLQDDYLPRQIPGFLDAVNPILSMNVVWTSTPYPFWMSIPSPESKPG